MHTTEDFERRLATPMAVAIAAFLAVAGLETAAAETSDPATELFVDVSSEVGFDFVHFNGMSGEFYFPEMTGTGAALFDYDNDGDLDIYVVQGAMMGPGKKIEQATLAPAHPQPLTDRLYRNDLSLGPDGKRRLKLTDVTEQAGLEEAAGYGMGVASGDFDRDGWTDLYVTRFGSNQLLKNRGDGSFEDVTTAAGADDTRWSVSAAFLDYDADGWLDLYVGNYVDFSYTVHKVCSTATGARDYCGPLAYKPEPDRLLHNLGNGRFENATAKAGLKTAGSALGVVTGDFDGNGSPDLYVANDEMANFLWLNQGDGTFLDDALLAGAALNSEGKPEASMGVDAGDYDNDGDLDLFMAHLVGETNTLYVNQGQGVFSDATRNSGLANASWNFTAFGTAFLDYDNDGLLDLVTVNGAVKTIEALALNDDPYPLHQTNQLFRNLGGRFREVSVEAGAAFALSEVSRGAAIGDIDNDGDTDLVVINNAGSARLLDNRVGQTNAWQGFELLPKDRRSALGARIELRLDDDTTLSRRVRTDGSYASANDPRVLFGLGSRQPVSVRVWWPGGGSEIWTDSPVGRYSQLVEGSGKQVP